MASSGDITVLGIETSCDETAAAVVRSNGDVLSDVIESQVAAHAPYGGIVPELASRDHLRNVRPVIEAALRAADVTLDQLDGIGPTLAARIVEWRAAHGGFASVDQLLEVPGIGPARLESLKSRVVP